MSLIGRFEHLPKRPKSDEARPLLEKIASQVKPIMNKRGWKVGTLAEFLPSNPALLGNNMNAGQRINLRLRPPGAVETFYEYDQLVLVMLHELTHIEHGPHDASFYKLLAILEEEFYDLKRKGYSGEGFHGTGNNVSGIKLDEYHGKARGLAAAQKRLDVQKTIGRGGVLGGSGTGGKSMKEVLANAAERRMRDDKTCHTQDHGMAADVEREVKKAQEESEGIDAIDLTGDDDEDITLDVTATPVVKREVPSTPPEPAPKQSRTITSTSNQVKPSTELPKQTIPKKRIPSKPAITQSNESPPAPSSAPPNDGWACPTCTLHNTATSLSCEACTTAKPVTRKSSKAGWICEFCGAGPRDMEFWSCTECGWVRNWG